MAEFAKYFICVIVLIIKSMKRLAGFYTLITISAFLFLPHVVFADSYTSVTSSNNGPDSQNDVSVQSNTGGNTICQNGNCTTTSGGNGQSTVCINGNCTTSTGDVDMQSDNGNTQVHITNGVSGAPVTISPVPTNTPTISPEPSLSPSVTITPDPTIAQMRKDIHKQIKKQIQELKQHVKDQDAALSSLMQSLQDFLNGLFK
jgi:hypothetical protein